MTLLLTVIGLFFALVLVAVLVVAYVARRYARIQGTSRAVKEWAAESAPTRKIGQLSTRTHGNLDAESAIVALHGLASSGAYFGKNWSALADEQTSLVVPDLLGFGDSLQKGRSAEEHSIEHHVSAVRETLDLAVPNAKQLHIVAHSFGSIIALALAREELDRVASVTLISPPLHDSREEAERYIVARGAVTRYFAVDRISARIFRAIICSRPVLARTFVRFAAPAMPSELARRTHLHTWASYVGTFRAFLNNRGWRSTMSLLAERGIPVRVVVGSLDHTIDRSVIDELPQTAPARKEAWWVPPSVTVLDSHGHQVPLTNPGGCVDLVRHAIEHLRTGAVSAGMSLNNPVNTGTEGASAIRSNLDGSLEATSG